MKGLSSERLVEDLLENRYRRVALPAVVAACYALKLGENPPRDFDAVAPQPCLPMLARMAADRSYTGPFGTHLRNEKRGTLEKTGR